jgi:Protein of unknown function (DUF664)
MRTILLALAAAATVSAAPLSNGDRQRLIAHLELTEGWLVSELAGLSDAQLRYRMSPESWSISDVVEHLAIAEPQYWKQLQDSLKQPAADYQSESTDADMRGRKLLEGNMDVYQWFLMISTHSQRHILQIREVKAHAGYPKG